MDTTAEQPARLGRMHQAGRQSAGLYIHVPFCETKCGYCDFYSVPLGDRNTAPLTRALIAELTQRVPAANQVIATIFCGGGTPTLLPFDQLAGLLGAVSDTVVTPDLLEFTVEANPATVDDAKARLLVAHGVTRVSMGAQSFFPDELATLERLHTPDDIEPSVSTLRANGVAQINLDLIFGIPGQTLETWERSLRRALDLEPDHLSCYGLTYEPGTRLTAQRHYGRLQPCDEDLEADMFELTMDLLAAAGFVQYEVSNYARPGKASRHNMLYWRNAPYIGIGPSAVGCYGGRRYRNVPDVGQYVRAIREKGSAESESEVLDTSMLMMEMIMMQLRLNDGMDLAYFERRTGRSAADVWSLTARRFFEEGLLEEAAGAWRLTRKGRPLAEYVIRELAGSIHDGDVALPILTNP